MARSNIYNLFVTGDDTAIFSSQLAPFARSIIAPALLVRGAYVIYTTLNLYFP